MTWTTDFPTEEGYYWHLGQPGAIAKIVLVVNHGRLVVYRSSTHGYVEGLKGVRRGVDVPVEQYGGEWAGPIPEPERGAGD